MRVFILSAINSIHTQRWVTSLSEKGVDVFLFSIHGETHNAIDALPNVESYVYASNLTPESHWLKKIKYLSIINTLKQKIKEFNPDVVHSHYASSYGLIGALAGFHPFIISLWGGDIYKFPKASVVNKMILKYNLSKADMLLSTSQIMTVEAKKYTNKEIKVTPFGVDLTLFKNKPRISSDGFVVGNVKTLSKNYGIDVLIESFKILSDNNPTLRLSLQIIGEGPDAAKLKNLTRQLGIEQKVKFFGNVDNDLLPDYFNNFDVAVSLSHSESFGVVAIEAMACECPVVVSDADGFTEVVINNETGFIVPRNHPVAAAHAIQQFIDNPELRETFGKNGRKQVEQFYNWEDNVDAMNKIYREVVIARTKKTKQGS